MTAVHNSFDFLQQCGTSYFNGQTEVNAESRHKISSGNMLTPHTLTTKTMVKTFISQANSGGLTQFRNSNGVFIADGDTHAHPATSLLQMT